MGLASLLAVYSSVGSVAYSMRNGDTFGYLIQHFLFLALGGALMYVSYKFHYMQYSRFAPLLLLICIPLLAYTLAFGVELNDARRWIMIPWIDKTFQTSDFAKLALIIYVARSLSLKQDFIKDWKSATKIIIPVVIVFLLIAPADLSTAALLFVTCLLMMFVGRVSLKFVGALIVLGIIAFGFLLLLGEMAPESIRVETWMSRIDDFMNNPDGGYQIRQSKIAIAEGGIFGVGPGHSTQRNFLPFPYADFIYAIICEEYGLFGGVLILGLYLWLLFRCVTIVTKCPKTFGAILAMGLCLNLVIQAFANMAVSVHLVPVTGLTLPLVSMGGTSVLFTCISLGIILSVSRYVEEAQLQKIELDKLEQLEDAGNN